MMVARKRYNPKASSKFVIPTHARFALLGQPLLIEGEDAAAYDELLRQLRAAVKPVDVIDEILTADMAQLQWDVLRYRRLKMALTREHQVGALKSSLNEYFNYDLRFKHFKHFVNYLAEILEDNLEGEPANAARTLASKYVRGKPDAVDKVNNILAGIELNMDQVETDARTRKVEELVQDYVRHNPDAVTEVEDFLAEAGLSMDALRASGLIERPEHLDYIERIECLCSSAESRRNASLREIDRRNAILGRALQRGVQEIEDAEVKMLERHRLQEKDAA